MLLGLVALRGVRLDAAPAGDHQRAAWLEDAHVSGVARSSALASWTYPSLKSVPWLLLAPQSYSTRRVTCGSQARLETNKRERARVSLTCYGVEALEAIVPSLKGCLADALPSLHRAGAAAAPIVHREGCPAAARARRRRDALGETPRGCATAAAL